jgi:hypothetical protein
MPPDRVALVFSLLFFGAGLVRAQDVSLSPGRLTFHYRRWRLQIVCRIGPAGQFEHQRRDARSVRNWVRFVKFAFALGNEYHEHYL